MPQLISVNINNILLDIDNFRLGSMNNQQEAIRTLIFDQKEKLMNLAFDIAEKGLNPTENIALVRVTDEKDKFYVVEGNRRILSVKILNNPDVLTGTSMEDYKQKVIDKTNEFNYQRIEELTCVIFSSQEDAYQWMQAKHSGENEGRGTVNWSAVAKARMEQKFGIPGDNTDALILLGFAENNGIPVSANYPITNLSRLIKTPIIREKLGLRHGETLLEADCPLKNLVDALSKIVPDLQTAGAVNRIFYRHDRVNYIESLNLPAFERVTPWVIDEYRCQPVPPQEENNAQERPETEESNNQTPPPIHNQRANADVIQRPTRTARRNAASPDRKRLIPGTCSIAISNPRVMAVFKELKSLDNSKFPNACAVMLRVFIELSLDIFMQEKQLGYNDGLSLNKKLDVVKTYLKDNEIMTTNELQPISSMLSNQDLPFSTRSLNAYVHNTQAIPLSNQILNNAWDSICPFMQKLWE